jgi:hypothetical protein
MASKIANRKILHFIAQSKTPRVAGRFEFLQGGVYFAFLLGLSAVWAFSFLATGFFSGLAFFSAFSFLAAFS